MYRDNSNTFLKKKDEWIRTIAKNVALRLPGVTTYHYTSIATIFDILEGDSFWVSSTRFSNDSSEERLLNDKEIGHDDNYIICFCEKGDQLSQWRGYCGGGGASIQFDMRGPMEYSILHADYDISRKYEIYWNAPLPVLYVKADSQLETIWNVLKSTDGDYAPAGIEDIVPYIKNGQFDEERELRLVFSNREEDLSSCVRFRVLENGVRVPYMIVKPGDISKALTKCTINLSTIDDTYMENRAQRMRPIIIPEGSDQEKIYYEVVKKRDSFCKANPQYDKIKIVCMGHLPVEKITIAPTYDRDLLMEQTKRYCMSKYWLRDVNVTVSNIPYIQPIR